MSEQQATPRMAILEIAPEVMRQLLDLPEGVWVDGVEVDFLRRGVVCVRVQGMGWPVREGEMLRRSRATVWERRNEAGEVFERRVTWEGESADGAMHQPGESAGPPAAL